jgi:hypothetical protein
MIRACMLFALGLAALPAAGQEVPLRPSDFAYGVTVVTSADSPLHSVALPRAVYENLTRDDLGDLRVFNARGEAVPYALRRPEEPKAANEWTTLPLFPVRSSERRSPGELVLRVERNAAGAILGVQARGTTPDAPVVGYLVDASADDQPIQALDIYWRDPAAGGFTGNLRVEASDDLSHWRSLAADAPLARLRHDGRLLERRRIEFAPVRTRYLWLSWLEPSRAAPLTAIRAERVTGTPLPAREWLALSPVSRGEKPGEYRFDLAGRMPVDRARLRLPQSNTVVNVELLARAGRAEPWRPRASGLAWRLRRNNAEVGSEDLVLQPGADSGREWLLRLTPPDAGAGEPVLELGWLPHTLVFAARGAGPFRLAYGSVGIASADYGVERLQESLAREHPVPVALAAISGQPETLGGVERLRESFTPRPWRKWLLWSVLVLGAFVLAWMATRLMDRHPPARGRRG